MNKQELNDKLLDVSFHGDLDTVKYLLTSPELKEHADINYKDNYGKNTLMWACDSGNLEIVKYLLTNKDLTEHADIHAKNNNSWNSLMIACYNGHLEIAQYLIIEMNITIDSETMNWLEGDNNKKEIFHEILNLIQARDLHVKLDKSIRDDKINNKKIKL